MKKYIFLIGTLFFASFALAQDMVTYNGITNPNTFGNSQILWFPSTGHGSLIYQHLKNKFHIKKTGNRYTLYEGSKETVLKLDFEYSNGKKRLIKIIKGKSFFNNAKINFEKNTVSITNEKNFLIAIAKSLHDLLKDKYKPTGNYTFSFKNVSNGSGIILVTDDGTAYVGGFSNGRFNGKGKVIYNDSFWNGSFKTGKRNGYFKVVNNDGRSSEGEFINNKREGIWKIKKPGDQPLEITYKDGTLIDASRNDKSNEDNSTENKSIANKKDSNLSKAKIEIKRTLSFFKKVKSSYDYLEVNMKSMTLREVKVKLAPLVNEYKAAAEYVITTKSYLEIAIQNASNSNCQEKANSLRKANSILDDFISSLNNTEDKLYVAIKTPSPNMAVEYLEKSRDSYKNAYKQLVRFSDQEVIYSQINCDYKGNLKKLKKSTPAPKPKTSKSNTQKTKPKKRSTIYVPPPKTYDANGTYPVFSGKYEGDDLFQLMGRHWENPAIKTWLTNTNTTFTQSANCDSEFCIYRADGITLTFIDSHLSEMGLGQSKKENEKGFRGTLPKGIRLGSAAKSINSIPVSWRKDEYGNNYFKENGITMHVYFDKSSRNKIDGIKLQKKIVADAKEDLEKGKVGVGLKISAYSGKVQVNNTLTGYAAKKAGIREGMQILEVDGQPVKGKSKYAVLAMIEGKKGTSVNVKFCRRNQEDKAKEYRLYRGAGGKAERITATTTPSNPKIKTTPVKKATSQAKKESKEIVGLGFTYGTGKGSETYEIFYLSSSSAAFKAGVRRSDDLLKVNGFSISGKSNDFVKKLIEGPKGTSVNVLIERGGKEMEFSIIR